MIPKTQTRLPSRKQRIDKAIAEAKRRDKQTCRVCGVFRRDDFTDGAHLLPRNAPFPMYDPADPAFILTLCRTHHRQYDTGHSVDMKIKWLKTHRLPDEARLLMQITGRMEKIPGAELHRRVKEMTKNAMG